MLRKSRGKVYTCATCGVRSDPITKGKPLGWQMGKATFDSNAGVWWGRGIRCPKHRDDSPTMTTLGLLLPPAVRDKLLGREAP